MTGIPLLCLPFAGAGASYYSPWRDRDERVQVRPLQLPGRENRLEEEPCTEVRAAVDDLVRNLPPAVTGGTAVAVFGHSLGAVLAFELVRRLETATGVVVRHLFVSGSPGPWSVRENGASGLTDEAFLRRVREFAGYEHPALADEELRDLILPAMRADVQMHESYRAAPDARVAAPVTVLRGAEDALVAEDEAAQWRAATLGDFRLMNLPGGHMYLTDQVDAILGLAAETLAEAAPVPGGAR